MEDVEQKNSPPLPQDQSKDDRPVFERLKSLAEGIRRYLLSSYYKTLQINLFIWESIFLKDTDLEVTKKEVNLC